MTRGCKGNSYVGFLKGAVRERERIAFDAMMQLCTCCCLLLCSPRVWVLVSTCFQFCIWLWWVSGKSHVEHIMLQVVHRGHVLFFTSSLLTSISWSCYIHTPVLLYHAIPLCHALLQHQWTPARLDVLFPPVSVVFSKVLPCSPRDSWCNGPMPWNVWPIIPASMLGQLKGEAAEDLGKRQLWVVI